MTVKFRGEEIETVVLDLDGTLYPQKKLEEVWDGVRWELATALLNVNGYEASDDEILGMVKKWMELSQGASWRKSYEGGG